MNALRRTLIAALMFSPLAAFAQGAAEEFNVLEPTQPTEASGKIEVLEFFWYGCPHCYEFEPVLAAWVTKLPADVEFRRVPAIYNDRWAHDARIYYTFEALALTGKLRRAFFDAIHRDRLRSDDPKALAEWLRTNGADPARFEQTLKSFGVQARVRRARQLSVSYKLEGVPTLAVHGRYTIRGKGGFEGMLQTADKLIAETRKTAATRR